MQVFDTCAVLQTGAIVRYMMIVSTVYYIIVPFYTRLLFAWFK